MKSGKTSDFSARLKPISTFACYELLELHHCKLNNKVEAEIHSGCPRTFNPGISPQTPE
ncbi:MAG: hypothetical protein PF518_09455 [Spirochaetaceae bacterium]|nr:hypothetical protein [Spirochaetaceae bacterium]